MKMSLKSLFIKLSVLVLVVLSGACSRSNQYKKDQSYYKTEYDTRPGKTTSRADRFGQPKKRVYILPFLNGTPMGGDELGEFSQLELLRELRGAGKAIVPEEIKDTSHSRDFYTGDKIRLAPLIKEGRRLGVAILVVGKIKKITYRTKGDEVGLFRKKQSLAAVDLEMRAFDIQNGKELLFDQRSADSSTNQLDLFGGDEEDPKSQRKELIQLALRNGMRLFTNTLTRAIEKLSWEGRIAKIVGGRIYVNAGRASGLNIGDILKVVTPGEDVFDPVTGAYMGRSPGQPKGTLEVVDYLGPDGSVTTVHSGGNFTENDAVQLY
jgi:hypothetical protein